MKSSSVGRAPGGKSGGRWFESNIKFPLAVIGTVAILGSYTVGVAGLAVNQLSYGSGGSTPSLPTRI